MENSERIKGSIAYAGVRRLIGGGIGHLYSMMDGKSITDKKHIYGKKLHKGNIGCVLDCEFSPDHQTVYYSKQFYPKSFLGWDNETVIQWRAESEAIETAERKKREGMKNATQNPLKELLDPLRDTYRGLSTSDRQCMLANIIEYITR